MREAAAWIHENESLSNEQKQRLMERLEQAVWGFSRSLTRHLLSPMEDQQDYAKDIRERLRPDLADDLVDARHKPTRALYELSCAVNEFPFDDRQIISIEKSVTILCDSMGSSERIFTSPVPRL
jgi:predicted membrane chloride channel (bestrophin family)